MEQFTSHYEVDNDHRYNQGKVELNIQHLHRNSLQVLHVPHKIPMDEIAVNESKLKYHFEHLLISSRSCVDCKDSSSEYKAMKMFFSFVMIINVSLHDEY